MTQSTFQTTNPSGVIMSFYLSLTRKNAKYYLALTAASFLPFSLPASADLCTDEPETGRAYYIVHAANGYNTLTATDKFATMSSIKNEANQQFEVTDLGNGFMTIKPANSTGVLSVELNSSEDGARTKLAPYNGDHNQEWKVERHKFYKLFNITARHSNKALSQVWDSSDTPVKQMPKDDSISGAWFFNPVDGNCKAPRKSAHEVISSTGNEANPDNPPEGFKHCAKEGETCTFTGQVDLLYGANGKYIHRTLRDVGNSIKCDNASGNPIPDVNKSCYIRPYIFQERNDDDLWGQKGADYPDDYVQPDITTSYCYENPGNNNGHRYKVDYYSEGGDVYLKYWEKQTWDNDKYVFGGKEYEYFRDGNLLPETKFSPAAVCKKVFNVNYSQ
jgi:hypothetical protein